MDAASRTIAAAFATMMEVEAKNNFEGTHARGEPHVGGDKPNIVTGTLRGSITHSPVVGGFGIWSTTVGTDVVYGRRVELGYPGGSGRGHAHTRPFPYLAPAAKTVEAKLEAIALAEFLKALM
jgi:hypothetical protein